MKSIPLAPGQNFFANQQESLRADAYGGSQLLAHQQLGVLALPTNPSNTQTWTLTVNGTAVTGAFVTAIGSTPGNVLIGASAAATAQNLIRLLQNPQLTNASQVALSSANQTLIYYQGYALNGTSITIFSLNSSVSAPVSSFTASTSATGGSWTAQTMKLYVEPGTYYIGTTRVLFLGGNTPTFTAPVTNPRIDIVTADSAGTITITQGSENVSPVAPSYPANKVVICEVYNVVGETAIYDFENQQAGQGYIYNDVRPIVAPPYISAAAQVATGLFILDPGSDAQGDILYYNGANWVLLTPGTSGFVLQTQGAGANPRWVLMAQTATVKDVSGPNITPNADNAWHTIQTYASVPAATAGSTVWLRGLIKNADTHVKIADDIRIQMNGTTIFQLSSNSAGGAVTSFYFDIMVMVPTPASAQTFSGWGGDDQTTFAIQFGTAAADLSSPYSIVVQFLQNTSGSPAMNNPVTIEFLEVNLIN